MKVLTVQSIESISENIQRDIHFVLRMEHHTDYVFKDNASQQYSATITLENTDEVIKTIVNSSAEIPEYTIMITELDMNNNRVSRYIIKNGEIHDQKNGSWEWEG